MKITSYLSDNLGFGDWSCHNFKYPGNKKLNHAAPLLQEIPYINLFTIMCHVVALFSSLIRILHVFPDPLGITDKKLVCDNKRTLLQCTQTGATQHVAY